MKKVFLFVAVLASMQTRAQDKHSYMEENLGRQHTLQEMQDYSHHLRAGITPSTYLYVLSFMLNEGFKQIGTKNLDGSYTVLDDNGNQVLLESATNETAAFALRNATLHYGALPTYLAADPMQRVHTSYYSFYDENHFGEELRKQYVVGEETEIFLDLDLSLLPNMNNVHGYHILFASCFCGNPTCMVLKPEVQAQRNAYVAPPASPVPTFQEQPKAFAGCPERTWTNLEGNFLVTYKQSTDCSVNIVNSVMQDEPKVKKGKPAWPWIVGGVVLVGGTVAIVELSQHKHPSGSNNGNNSTPPDNSSTPPDNGGPTNVPTHSGQRTANPDQGSGTSVAIMMPCRANFMALQATSVRSFLQPRGSNASMLNDYAASKKAAYSKIVLEKPKPILGFTVSIPIGGKFSLLRDIAPFVLR